MTSGGPLVTSLTLFSRALALCDRRFTPKGHDAKGHEAARAPRLVSFGAEAVTFEAGVLLEQGEGHSPTAWEQEALMKVLVPLDGSTFAEAVLPSVEKLAADGSVTVTLATVVNPAGQRTTWVRPPVMPEDVRGRADVGGGIVVPTDTRRSVPAESRMQAEEAARTEAEDYLTRTAHQRFPEGAQIRVLLGSDVAEQLLAFARQEEVDLIAMATHGRTGVAMVVMGSIADKILRAGVAPVMMVRPERLK